MDNEHHRRTFVNVNYRDLVGCTSDQSRLLIFHCTNGLVDGSKVTGNKSSFLAPSRLNALGPRLEIALANTVLSAVAQVLLHDVTGRP